ncbi:hypothetical protein DCAR_0104270 [Daucus carota subsp. sativus]|uniref:Uncharacterized protein n=1 Tax=Daucus carota subsp. sativus TaxID=79200 RepID=A0A166IPP2_DAUCS|nr:PREDICTED: probable inactive dual specificity protein phosphatase-like At4g18593 isoform X1 [Daucus carota subsp. sativus]WOG85083.1 hypothetical protein DCAR_0104270 [Daucus carota subsp. sativus]
MEESSSLDCRSEPIPQIIYRCKKCRRIVASQEQIVSHEPGAKKGFRWTGKKGGPVHMNEEPAECSSIYVEPMKWMEAVQEGFVGQKLQCIGCKGRLGSFNWAGMRCNCGAWVIPAFQLHKNRMDECSL